MLYNSKSVVAVVESDPYPPNGMVVYVNVIEYAELPGYTFQPNIPVGLYHGQHGIIDAELRQGDVVLIQEVPTGTRRINGFPVEGGWRFYITAYKRP